MSNSSFDFDYRGRPAALRAAPTSTFYRDRATEINVQMALERSRAQSLKSAFAAAVMAGCVALAGFAGFALSSDPRGVDDLRTFELVQFHGDESDIIDYDLSREDCAARLLAAATNERLACELSN